MKREIEKGLLLLIGVSIFQAGIWLSYSTFASTIQQPFHASSLKKLGEEALKVNLADPEQQPLSTYEKHHEQARKASGRSMGRLLMGLLGVLVLFACCARWAFPRLMERYPEFFEYWRRHYQSQKEISNRVEVDESPNGNINLSEIHYKGLGDTSQGMQLLSSTVLNARQELHLVAIGEHQFIIASSPEGVSNLGELSTLSKTVSAVPSGLNDQFPISIPTSSQIRAEQFSHQAFRLISKECKPPATRIKREFLFKQKPYARPPKPNTKSLAHIRRVENMTSSEKKDKMNIELLKDYDDIY